MNSMRGSCDCDGDGDEEEKEEEKRKRKRKRKIRIGIGMREGDKASGEIATPPRTTTPQHINTGSAANNGRHTPTLSHRIRPDQTTSRYQSKVTRKIRDIKFPVGTRHLGEYQL
ncbi:hypothetical protein TWF106_001748 [Orbilia oligospora]|uniref:Uncharacterized protein n=1 Tax=Orbilia oligospora TaxID=2813651 RepID=A0A7C8UR53_ORBOL|nr:hypothetical protein TWF679_007110 [Orbilia oligospora]KAF3225875.1 hypothetical protein TWF106_001748 [Orbilia oligospora]